MSDDESTKPTKKQRRPRALSSAATSEASDLTKLNSQTSSMLHTRIGETAVGNHQLLANASMAPAKLTESERNRAHSAELTRILYEGGTNEIGVSQHNVESCCANHTISTPKDDVDRERMTQLYAGKSLKEFVTDLVKQIRTENPKMDRKKVAEQTTQRLDAELHLLQHRYELAHGIPGVDTIDKRFKLWLNVRPGITQNEIEAGLRQKMPEASPSYISGMAKTQMQADDKKKKAAFQIHVSDDKVQQMLLNAYKSGDEEAGKIYIDWRARQIKLQATSAEEEQTRLEEMRMSVEATLEQARKEATLDASLRSADEMRAAAERETLRTVARIDSEKGLLLGSDGGVVVEPGPHTAGEFLRAYTQDQSACPEKIIQDHCSAIVTDLMSSINLMATMLAVAPPGSTFGADSDGDAIDTLYLMMRSEDAKHSLSSETLHLYVQQWHRVQSESQSDVDRELVRAHKHAEHKAIQNRMHLDGGLTKREVDSAMTFGVRPEMSPVFQVVAAATQLDNYALVRAEAMAASKLEQRNEQRAKEIVRESNRTGHRLKMDDAYKVMLEGVARQIPERTRGYTQEFLSEAAGPEFFERSCVKGDLCVCRVKRAVFPSMPFSGSGNSRSATTGFICREFLLPDQLREVKATGKLPETVRMCLPCNIYYTSENVMSYAVQKQGCQERMPLMLLQDHCVLTEQAGEYAKESTLPHTLANGRPSGVVRPFQAWSDANYAYGRTTRNGKELACLVETDASVFRLPSDRETRI